MASPKPMERKFLHRILLVALGSSVLLFVPIVAQLAYLQCRRHDYYTMKARSLHSKTVKITPQRGSIFDTNGYPLATSTFRETAYLAPRYLKKAQQDDPQFLRRLALRLSTCLSLPLKNVEQKVNEKRDSILQRKLPPELEAELRSLREELDIPSHALYFVREGTRLYPKGDLGSQILGFTKPDDFGDNIGLAGVEAQYNKDMAGAYFKDKVLVDVRQQDLSPREDEVLLKATGNDVYLTINSAIQEYAQAALNEHVAKFEAKGGVCIVMEVGTGDILAMASNPMFSAHTRGGSPVAAQKNRCISDAISPGSVMKTFTSVALLEENKLSPSEMIDCHLGRITYPGGRTIVDAHRLGVVPVWMAFAESSNVGYSLLGLRLEKEELDSHFRRFGFGKPTGVDLPGEGAGIMYNIDRWTYQSRISLPIGYEILCTPIQIASAMAGIANKGLYVKPHVLKEIRSPKNELVYQYVPRVTHRVCSPQTTEILFSMMEDVITTGTGDQAAVPGYRIGGKTGTTVKDKAAGDDRPGKRYYASFLGVAPIGGPRSVVIYTWVDEPNVKWGGSVGAPLFGQVAEHTLRVLGIAPTEPVVPRPTPRETVQSEPAEPPRKLVSALPAPADGGLLMPDFTGQSVREVAATLHRLGIDAQLTGWGTAVQQRPLPGEVLANNTRGLIVFAPLTQIDDPTTGTDLTSATRTTAGSLPKRTPSSGDNAASGTARHTATSRSASSHRVATQ